MIGLSASAASLPLFSSTKRPGDSDERPRRRRQQRDADAEDEKRAVDLYLCAVLGLAVLDAVSFPRVVQVYPPRGVYPYVARGV